VQKSYYSVLLFPRPDRAGPFSPGLLKDEPDSRCELGVSRCEFIKLALSIFDSLSVFTHNGRIAGTLGPFYTADRFTDVIDGWV
jgi:hypothetical protein